YTEISKQAMPRNDIDDSVDPEIANPCTDGAFSSTLQSGFRMGDTACFELVVDFPGSIDVRNPVVTDFLPTGLSYQGHQVQPGSPVVDSTVLAEEDGRIDWYIGAEGDGGDLYV